MKTASIVFLLVLSAAGPATAADWELSGDVRAGLLGSETRTRAGVTSDTYSGRARVRAGTGASLGDDWSFTVRAAARLDTRQDDLEFELDWAAPGPGGLGNGDVTIDSLFFTLAPDGSPWQVRLGRFQAAFELDGVAKKSLDRNDSPSFDVTWTDGAWVQRRGDAWTTHFIVQHNDASGPTNTLRPPLAFDDGASRVGAFVGLEANAPAGPFVQRMIGFTWLPQALAPFGPGHGERDDYLAATAKAAAAWNLGASQRRLLVAGEVGYAPNTPDQTVMGSGNGDASGLAWQASVNLFDVFPSHNVGVVYSRVGDGWLISPDFSANDWALEARWFWRVNPALAFDARVRRRSEIDLPFPLLHPRRIEDFYVRATWRF